MDALLRVQEVAKLLAVSIATVYRLIDRGDLQAVRVGALLRVRPADLDAYLERRATAQAEEAGRSDAERSLREAELRALGLWPPAELEIAQAAGGASSEQPVGGL